MNKDLNHIKELLYKSGEETHLSSRDNRISKKLAYIRSSLTTLGRAIQDLAEDIYEEEEEEPTPSITPLEEFLNDYGLSVSCKYSQHTEKWHASLDNAKVVVQNRKFFKPPVETSDSLDEAVFYLAKRLRGEELEVEGGYVRVPKNLTYQYNE